MRNKKILTGLLCFALICVPAFAEDILEARVEALRSLGLEISAEAVEHVRESVDEIWEYIPEDFIDENGKAMFYDFPNVLSMIGSGLLDAETFTREPLTDDFYALDAEMWEIPGDYFVLLEAVERLSDGGVVIDGCDCQVDEADLTSGEGEMLITFALNGTPCEFNAQLMYDWMDCRIVDALNERLAESGTDDRVWCMFDGGQGFVLFYNDAQWARRFADVTGCGLYLSPDEASAAYFE